MMLLRSGPNVPTVAVTQRQRDEMRRAQMIQERSSWLTLWKELSDRIWPDASRFLITERNKGGKRHGSIYNNTATRAARIMAAGFMAGGTSPARPWFKLQTPDPSLNKYRPVMDWLDEHTARMQTVFQRSNTYIALQQLYESAGVFGTGGSVVMPSFRRVLNHSPLPIGSYAYATDPEGVVNTMLRDFQMTVAECVDEFGLEQCSTEVQTQFRNGSVESPVAIAHLIEPRRNRDTGKIDARNMPFRSVYWECGGREDKYLRESGFMQFPVLAPRFYLNGNDVYGRSPGMEALGDTNSLQLKELAMATGIDKVIDPPTQIPTSMQGQEVDTLPGGRNYYDANSPSAGVRSLYDVRIDLDHMAMNIEKNERRINSTFFVDLFLMIASANDSTERTKAEILARNEEKFMVLGPALERQEHEVQRPLIYIAFDRMIETGLVSPAPEELQGMPLQIEFTSILAQAQRAIGINGIRNWMADLAGAANLKPDVIDKVDWDQWVDDTGQMWGVPSRMIVPTNKVVQLREARAKARAAEAQLAAAGSVAKAARDIGSGGQEALSAFGATQAIAG